MDVSVDQSGGAFLDKRPIGDNELVAALTAARKANPNLRVFISGDRDARHGDIIHVLDLVRSGRHRQSRVRNPPARKAAQP